MTLNYEVRIFREFRGISQILEATTTKRQSCNPLNVLFNIMFLAFICRRFLHYRGLHALTAVCCCALTLVLARLSCVDADDADC